MSDKSLFENSDEQEKAYAPEQRPDFTPNPTAGQDEAAGPLMTGLALESGGAFRAADMGTPLSNAPAGGASEIAPVVGATALAEETEEDDANNQA